MIPKCNGPTGCYYMQQTLKKSHHATGFLHEILWGFQCLRHVLAKVPRENLKYISHRVDSIYLLQAGNGHNDNYSHFNV